MNLEKVVAVIEIQKQVQHHAKAIAQCQFNPVQSFHDAINPVNKIANQNVKRLAKQN